MQKYKIAMMGNTVGLSFGQIRDEVHIKEALKELGHEIYENDSSKELLETVDFILAFKSNDIGPAQVKDWRLKTNVPIFIWTYDNMSRFEWFYDVARECDVWLGEELGRREKLWNDNLPFYYFPHHADDPKYFHPLSVTGGMKIESKYDVIFTGTPYWDDKNEKVGILKAVDERFDLHIFGNNENGWRQNGFKNVHPAAFDENLSQLIGRSKIVLSISNTLLEGYWSIRASQIMLCGGFCLQRFTPQMEKESKHHVVYWNEKNDLLEKISYYLANEGERSRIAEDAYYYAKENLTTLQRCRELTILFENYDQVKNSIKRV